MDGILQQLLPNVMNKLPELAKSIWQTIYMVGVAGGISFVFGLFFGVILAVTKKGGIMQNLPLYHVLDKIVNVLRSVPFIILLAALIPLTRILVGTAIGTKGVMFPLIVGTVPFFTRQIEGALSEVSHGLIEAAQSMGSSPMEIIFRVYLKESIPGLARAATITFTSLIGLTAMAGAVGGGGLGDLAIRYGHQRNQIDVTYVTVVLLLCMVSIIQGIGSIVIKKTTH